MNELSKVSVVLPSLDPDEKLVAVIDGLLEYGFSHIILVNDGSKPENLHYFEDAAAQHPEITVAVDAACCAGVTPQSHEAALQTMKMCQVRVK